MNVIVSPEELDAVCQEQIWIKVKHSKYNGQLPPYLG